MTWTAWTRITSDATADGIVAELARNWVGATGFGEGPQDEDWIQPSDLASRIGRLWLLRLFGTSGELAGRRVAWEGDHAWMLRIVAETPPPGDGWVPVSVGAPHERSLVLYGTKEDEGFREGSRFRDSFAHPAHPVTADGRAVLVVAEHPVDDGGGAIVRWVGFETRKAPKGGSRGR